MTYLIILFSLFAIQSGCASQSAGEAGEVTDKTDQSANHSVAFGDTLRYELGFFGDEDRAQVAQFPAYNAFEGFCSKNREPLIYCYTPRQPMTGTDTIVFKLSFGSDGSNPPTETVIQKLIIELKTE